jgi:hypothetical protein
MTDGHAICKHCGRRIERDVNNMTWIHNVQTPYEQSRFVYCGNEYGTNAEPTEEL